MSVGNYENVIIGSGEGGKYLAWHLAQSGQQTVVVERRWVGGSCPNVNCLPSKNEIWSAKVADLVHHATRFGITLGSAASDMAAVRKTKTRDGRGSDRHALIPLQGKRCRTCHGRSEVYGSQDA